MKRIFLIGYMGAGKTTLGKVLAQKMDLDFIDLDLFIQSRFRKSVSELFVLKGEDGFRQIEKKILHEIGEFEDVIISTGGGAPCFFDNLDFMLKKGVTIYLDVTVDELVKRLSVSKNERPILANRKGEELRLFIEENLQKRKSYYLQARYHFAADKMDTQEDVYNMAEKMIIQFSL